MAEVDVTLPAQSESWIQDVGSNGGIDILANAAAVQTFGTTESTDFDNWNRVVAANLTSCFRTSHFAYPILKQRGDRPCIFGSGPCKPERGFGLCYQQGRNSRANEGTGR